MKEFNPFVFDSIKFGSFNGGGEVAYATVAATAAASAMIPVAGPIIAASLGTILGIVKMGGLLGQQHKSDLVNTLRLKIVSDMATATGLSSDTISKYVSYNQVNSIISETSVDSTKKTFDANSDLIYSAQEKQIDWSKWPSLTRTTWYYVSKTKMANVIAQSLADMNKDGLISISEEKKSDFLTANVASMGKYAILIIASIFGIGFLAKGIKARRAM